MKVANDMDDEPKRELALAKVAARVADQPGEEFERLERVAFGRSAVIFDPADGYVMPGAGGLLPERVGVGPHFVGPGRGVVERLGAVLDLDQRLDVGRVADALGGRAVAARLGDRGLLDRVGGALTDAELWVTPEVFTEGAGFWFARVHPDDRARVEQVLQKAINDGSDEWSAGTSIASIDATTSGMNTPPTPPPATQQPAQPKAQ